MAHGEDRSNNPTAPYFTMPLLYMPSGGHCPPASQSSSYTNPIISHRSFTLKLFTETKQPQVTPLPSYSGINHFQAWYTSEYERELSEIIGPPGRPERSKTV